MIGRHCYLLPDRNVIYKITAVRSSNHNFKLDDLKYEKESKFVDLESTEDNHNVDNVESNLIWLIEN